MSYKIAAKFTLTDFECSPREITERLGISPTKTWEIGDLISPRGQREYEFNGWRLDSELHNSLDLEEQLKALLQQLDVAWKELAKTCQQYESEFSFVIYLDNDDGQIPAVHFSPELIAKIHQLNAAIDLDIYVS